MSKFVAFAVVLLACTSHEKSREEPKLFRPNYNLKVDDLLKTGYVLEEGDDGFSAVKQFNDTANVKIQIDHKLGLPLREIWQVKFRTSDIEKLRYFLLNQSVTVVSEICNYNKNSDEAEKTAVGGYVNLNFFVQNGLSGRLFQCNFGDGEGGGALLQVIHDYPFNYRDEGNPRFRDVFVDWEEILRTQKANEEFSRDESKKWKP